MPTVTMIPIKISKDSRSFVVPVLSGPAIRGKGGTSYACSSCHTILLENVAPENVQDIAVRCKACGEVSGVPNTVPPTPSVGGLAAAPASGAVRKTITIVTPCYNEEENIPDVYASVKALFDGPLANYNREHIFADNASTDRSPAMLRDLAATDPSVRVIFNARNFGPMKNTYNGVMAASGDAVLLFLPADMQDPPELLPLFVKLWEQGNEIVYGIRATREESVIMRSVRNLYYQILTSFSDVKVPPGVGDFQLVDQSVVRAMRDIRDSYPFLRMMTFECGGTRIGVSYRWRARRRGLSKNRMTALIDQGLNGLISFTTVPLRLGLYLGFVTALIAVIYAVATIVIEIIGAGRPAPPGIPTLIVALFFFGGVQLFFMGLIGEYILAIYSQVRTKPVVFERERLNFPKDAPKV